MGTTSVLPPRLLAYADQNFLISAADDQTHRERLIQLRDRGEVGIVLSPWHLYEIGKGNPEQVERMVDYLEHLDPFWMLPRLDLLTWEFAAAWALFWRGELLDFHAIGSLNHVISDMRSLIPTAQTIRQGVASFQFPQVRAHMQWSLDPHRYVSRENRRAFQRGLFDNGLRYRTDLQLAALHLARMRGVRLTDPRLDTVRTAILDHGLMKTQIDFFLEFGGRDYLKGAEIEWQMTLQFYSTKAELDTNRFVDRQHAIVALPYCDIFLTNDSDLTRRCLAVQQSVPFRTAEVLRLDEFFRRF
jgi:hypothetical protein